MENYESYDLTDEQWERIQPLLPPENTGKKGRPRKDDRMMLNGMLWMNHSGAQWRQIPVRYGSWQSVYARFAKWRDEGIWENIFSALSQDADTENLSINSTCIKVHESSNGGEKRGFGLLIASCNGLVAVDVVRKSRNGGQRSGNCCS